MAKTKEKSHPAASKTLSKKSNLKIKSLQKSSKVSRNVKSSTVKSSLNRGRSSLNAKTTIMDTSKSQNSRIRTKKKSAKPVRKPFVLDEKTEEMLKENHYEIKEKLGTGAFSEVFRAYHSQKKRSFAVKIIDLMMMNQKYHTKFLPREIENLAEVRHDYVIRIYDIFRMNNRILIFMERATKGDLAKYLKNLHRPMEERVACKWFYQMSTALHYMHNELSIAHRDIKIDNILITEDNDVKLTDFGFSLHVVENDDNEPQLSTTFCGTRPYLSPQIVSKQAYNPFKADIWAFGVVLFAMLNNRYPFHYKDRKAMLKEQKNREYISGRFISELSESAKELMLAMFELEEEVRIDVEKILEHEWVVTNLDKDLVVDVEE